MSEDWITKEHAEIECYHCGGSGTAEAYGQVGDCAECDALGRIEPKSADDLLMVRIALDFGAGGG